MMIKKIQPIQEEVSKDKILKEGVHRVNQDKVVKEGVSKVKGVDSRAEAKEEIKQVKRVQRLKKIPKMEKMLTKMSS